MKQYLLSCILFCLALPLCAQGISESYNYPLRPGSEGWKSAKNHAELRAKSQIPNEVISKMSTPKLLNSVLNYPLIGDVMIFPTFRQGIQHLRENFIAFDSLMNRSDVIEIIIPAYENYDPLKVSTLQDPIEIGEFMLGLSLMEFMANTKIKSNSFDAERKKQFTKELFEKYNQKQQLIDIYGVLGTSTTLWALSQVLDSETASKTFSSEFIENGFAFNNPELLLKMKQIEKSIE